MMFAHGVEGMLLNNPGLTPEQLKGPDLYETIIKRKGLHGIMVGVRCRKLHLFTFHMHGPGSKFLRLLSLNGRAR
jgi:hypothetical protein